MASLSCVLLPLDDRPINTSQMTALARVAQIELKLPPPALVASHGDWDFEKMFAWLDFQMGWNEVAIISVDQFLYGGLIHSRTQRTKSAEALARLERLQQLIQKHDCRTYLSSVLLRLSITVGGTQSEADWKAVFQYSVLKDKHLQGLVTAEELSEVERRIPSSLLSEYLYARERNATINLQLVEMAETVDYLLFGQEDCAPFGLHRIEKQKLVERIGREMTGVQKRISVLTGADEMNACLLARAACETWDVKPQSVPIVFEGLDTVTRDAVSRYEDVTVDENISAHLCSSPFFWDTENADATAVRVRCFGFADSSQPDLYFLQQSRQAVSTLQATPTDESWPSGVALLDLSFSNGAHPQRVGQLIKGWCSRQTLPLSFSAWNTTGNRLGTLIAHLAILTAAKQQGVFDETAHQLYTFTRLLDDYGYQSVVRAQLQDRCSAAGCNPWALTATQHAELQTQGQQLMNELVKSWEWPSLRVSFELKWARLFEADVTPLFE